MKFFISVFLCCVVATLSPAQSTGGGGTVYLRQLERGTAGYVITGQGAGAVPIYTALAGAGIGDFSGPASSTANAIVRFSGVGGKTGKDSAVTIADTTGAMAWGTGTTASLTSLAGTNLLLAAGTAGTGAVRVTNTTAASSTITGAFRVGNDAASTTVSIGGGVIYAGGPIFGNVVSAATSSTATTYMEAGLGSAKAVEIGGGASSGYLKAYNTTGGVTTALTILSATTHSDTTAATSTTTGSLINAGGFGNAGAAHIGGNLIVGGNTTAGANLTILGVLTMGGSVSPAQGSTGNTGMIIWDANYIYICIAANTWKRAAITTY